MSAVLTYDNVENADWRPSLGHRDGDSWTGSISAASLDASIAVTATLVDDEIIDVTSADFDFAVSDMEYDNTDEGRAGVVFGALYGLRVNR